MMNADNDYIDWQEYCDGELEEPDYYVPHELPRYPNETFLEWIERCYDEDGWVVM